MTDLLPSPESFDRALGSDLLAALDEYRRFLDDPSYEPADESIDSVVHRIAGSLLGRRDSIASGVRA